MEVLQEDRIMYRAGNVQNPYGRWFTSEDNNVYANLYRCIVDFEVVEKIPFNNRLEDRRMIRNEALLQLREAYIEIGKMVQKYGYGQYNGILRILMGQVNCIDSDESDGEKMKYLIESYSKLFASRGGLSDFIIYDADVQLRNQLNEKYNDEVKRAWNIMKDYI